MTLFAVNPNRSTRIRTWFGRSCAGFGCDTSTEETPCWGELDNLGTARVRFLSVMVEDKCSDKGSTFSRGVQRGYAHACRSGSSQWTNDRFFCMHALWVSRTDWISTGWYVYITCLSQPYDMRARRKTTAYSYSYLEAIDTVNNEQNEESNNTTIQPVHFVRGRSKEEFF